MDLCALPTPVIGALFIWQHTNHHRLVVVCALGKTPFSWYQVTLNFEFKSLSDGRGRPLHPAQLNSGQIWVGAKSSKRRHCNINKRGAEKWVCAWLNTIPFKRVLHILFGINPQRRFFLAAIDLFAFFSLARYTSPSLLEVLACDCETKCPLHHFRLVPSVATLTFLFINYILCCILGPAFAPTWFKGMAQYHHYRHHRIRRKKNPLWKFIEEAVGRCVWTCFWQ